MKFTKTVIAAAVLATAFGVTAASAAPNTTECIKMAGQVRQAIEANGSSANLKAAKAEQSAGRYFCLSGVYDKGVAHYQAALDLLGAK